MRRRDVLYSLATVAAATAIPACPSCAAASRARGCWLNASDGSISLDGVAATSGRADVDALCRQEVPSLTAAFGTTATLLFYDDRDAQNAFATTEIGDPSKPDGTVFIGTTLAAGMMDAYAASGGLPLVGIMAHEWGHLLQFRKNVGRAWGVHFELSADHLAGWYLARTRPDLDRRKDEVTQLFASLGSTTGFAHPDFHGSPKQRSRMLLTGARLHGIADGDPQATRLTATADLALEESLSKFGAVGGGR